MKGKREILIGLIAAVAVAGLIVGMFFLKGVNVFGNNRTFHTTYDRVGGLVNASFVNVSGFKVGSVTDIQLNIEDPTKIDVYFVVDNPDLEIPENSLAVLASDILGTKSIDLRLGKKVDGVKLLQDGDFIESQAQEELTDMVNEQLLPLKLKTEELIGTIDSTVVTVKTILGNNTANLDASFTGLNKAIQSFVSVANQLDTLIASQQGNIKSILANVNSITQNLKNSNQNITNILANADTMSANLAQIDLQPIIDSAQVAINGVNQVLASLNNTEGSVYQLLNDKQLYQNVTEMVDQADRLIENIMEHPNRYLQFAVFGSKDRGIKLDARDEKRFKKWVEDSLKLYYPN